MNAKPLFKLMRLNSGFVIKAVHIAVLVIGGLFFGTGCGSSQMIIPPVEVKTPVNVSAFNFAKINFVKIKSLLLPGQIIGAHIDGLAYIKQFDYHAEGIVSSEWEERYKRIVLDELSNAGYNVVQQSGLFENDDSFDARFLIGGTITSASLQTFGSFAGNYTEMFLEIEWEVFDKEARKTIFKSKTGGYAKTSGVTAEASLSALRASIRNLLAENNLVEALRSIPTSASSSDSITRVDYHNNNEELNKTANKLALVSKAVFAIKTERGHGTGFIINPEGYAITNYHVLENRSFFDAIFSDGKTIRLNVLKAIPEKDLALLKLSGEGYPYLPLIEQAELEVGQEVYAIGTPLTLGLSHTISKGIVSGTRKLETLTLIQTDASINPGNSGGPLTNNQGKVIGVVSLKLAGPGLEGLGFAISIEDVKKEFQLKSAQK